MSTLDASEPITMHATSKPISVYREVCRYLTTLVDILERTHDANDAALESFDIKCFHDLYSLNASIAERIWSAENGHIGAIVGLFEPLAKRELLDIVTDMAGVLLSENEPTARTFEEANALDEMLCLRNKCIRVQSRYWSNDENDEDEDEGEDDEDEDEQEDEYDSEEGYLSDEPDSELDEQEDQHEQNEQRTTES